MKKNKILHMASVVAIAMIFQIIFCIPAMAVTIIGANTSMVFSILGGGGSYAPYTVSTNPDGEYCMRGESTGTLRLSGNLSNYGVNNVYFTVQGGSYAGSGTNSGPLVTVPATLSQGVWTGVFSFEDCGSYDGYTVKCYADDGAGYIYYWSKTIKNDGTRPTISEVYVGSDDLKIVDSNGKAVINGNANISVYISDGTPYATSWIKEVKMKLYVVGQSQAIQENILPLLGNQNWGTYQTSFNLLGFGSVEKS